MSCLLVPSVHCPTIPSFETILQTLEGFANGVRYQAGNCFAWVSKDPEGGKRGLFKLLWKSWNNLANKKSSHTHKGHKREELNNFVNKGIITLNGLIHT